MLFRVNIIVKMNTTALLILTPSITRKFAIVKRQKTKRHAQSNTNKTVMNLIKNDCIIYAATICKRSMSETMICKIGAANAKTFAY